MWHAVQQCKYFFITIYCVINFSIMFHKKGRKQNCEIGQKLDFCSLANFMFLIDLCLLIFSLKSRSKDPFGWIFAARWSSWNRPSTLTGHNWLESSLKTLQVSRIMRFWISLTKICEKWNETCFGHLGVQNKKILFLFFVRDLKSRYLEIFVKIYISEPFVYFIGNPW